MKLKALLLALLLYNPLFGQINGGEFSFKNLNADTFEISLQLYRNCSDVSFTANNLTISAESSCGDTILFTLFRVGNPKDISLICSQSTSNCSGGNISGTEKHLFTNTLVLHSSCNEWRFIYKANQNKGSINLAPNQTMNIEAFMHKNEQQNNHSPIQHIDKYPVFCSSSDASFYPFITDPDGDKMVFSVHCKYSYTLNYSCSVPLTNFKIDSLTGLITFSAPSLIGFYSLVIEVKEYSKDGKYKSSIIFDQVFKVDACPYNSIGTINITNSYGTPFKNNRFEVCNIDTFKFDFNFSSTIPSDSLFLSSNIEEIFPGSFLHWNSQGNMVNGTVEIPPFTSIDKEYVFYIRKYRNSCPYSTVFDERFTLNIHGSTSILGNDILCINDTLKLIAKGGSHFNWKIISGDSAAANNFTCDTCQYFWATPLTATQYVLESNLNNTCKNSDTIHIHIVDTPNVQIKIKSNYVFSFITYRHHNYIYIDTSGFDVDSFLNLYTLNWRVFLECNYNNEITSLIGQGEPILKDYENRFGIQSCVLLTITDTNGCKSTFTHFAVFYWSVEENFGNAKLFHLYPNPSTHGEFSIHSTENGLYAFTIYDSKGRKLMHLNEQFFHKDETKSYHFKELGTGMYFIKLQSDKHIETLRLLIQK
jgi:hypothetical protein